MTIFIWINLVFDALHSWFVKKIRVGGWSFVSSNIAKYRCGSQSRRNRDQRQFARTRCTWTHSSDSRDVHRIIVYHYCIYLLNDITCMYKRKNKMCRVSHAAGTDSHSCFVENKKLVKVKVEPLFRSAAKIRRTKNYISMQFFTLEKCIQKLQCKRSAWTK